MTVTPHNLDDEGTTRSKARTESSVAVASTGAIFTSISTSTDAVLVRVHGDIDMRSAPILRDYVCGRVSVGVRLILDLTNVDFFGIAGLTVFTALDETAESAGTTWCLVEGHAVHRLLEAASVVPSVRRFKTVDSAL